MPKPRKISAYPTEFFRLFEKALDGGEPIEVPMENKKKAEGLRFDLYAFRKALHEDVENATFDELQLALLSDSLEFLVRDNILIVQSRERTASAEAIRAVLDGE